MSMLTQTQPLMSFSRQATWRRCEIDCSKDLLPYRRSLGPTTREQFQRIHASRPSIMERPGPSQPVAYTNGLQSVEVTQPNVIPLPTSHGRQASSVAAQNGHNGLSSTSNSLRVPEPNADDTNTYPPELRNALEQCTARYQPQQPGTIFHIIQDVVRKYMGDSQDIVGSYQDLHLANLAAAKYFLENYWYEGMETPSFESRSNGTLHCEIETDGSSGGTESIYVRIGRLK